VIDLSSEEAVTISDHLNWRKHIPWTLVPIPNGELERTGPREVVEAAESSFYTRSLHKAERPHERLWP
jgi:hypothetical protein